MDIQFTKDGKTYIVPFGTTWTPSQRTLIVIQQEFPDAKIVDSYDVEIWEDQPCFGLNCGYDAWLVEPTNAR